MKTLGHTALSRPPSLDPLPWNFPQWQQAKIVPRRGATTMIAGTSGAGKTFLATKIIEKCAEPTLFFSADTDEGTMVVRAAAILTGEPQEMIWEALKEDGAPHYAKVLADSSFRDARFVFESDPTYEDLELETCAMAEVYGDFPKIICIDNVMNLVGEREDEWASMRDSMKAIKRLVRITGSAAIVLHHMSEESRHPEIPAPKRHVHGKVSQVPEVILSLAISEDGSVQRVCPVKNRWGPADPSGNNYVEVPVDLEVGGFYRDHAMKKVGIPL